MNILLIEDEEPAANRIIKLINQIDSSFTVIETIVSVKSALEWLRYSTR
jgi:response regulator of citrate/malate metabolism